MPGWIGPWEIAILLVIVLLVFGPKRLPEMGRSLGRGMREFKNSVTHDDVDALAVPQELTRVLLNLIGNGFYAANERGREGDGTFRPTLKMTTREFGESVEIRVRDNGVGIPPEIKDKLFQPFFTTKPTGEGTGLGLSISYDIVTQQHGGTIEVDSRVGEFTEFTVRLPRRTIPRAVA